VQSVFDGSCISVDRSQCSSARQNSDPHVDVRATFQAACGSGTYSANACGGTWAGCCLWLTPSDVAGVMTKILACDATITVLADYQAGCALAGGTYQAAVPQL
jgi:hypothetical protein